MKFNSKQEHNKKLNAIMEYQTETTSENQINKDLLEENHRLKKQVSHLRSELQCIFQLTELVERYNSQLAPILEGLVDILKEATEKPNATFVRIHMDNRTFTTTPFQEKNWQLRVDIKVLGEAQGLIELHRDKYDSTLRETPFSPEEELLIHVIAERIGRIAERVSAQRQLEIEQKTVNNTNIALKEVLTRVQDEKAEIGRTIQENVTKIVLPLVHEIERELKPARPKLIEILKRQLDELTSPFTYALSNQFSSLTMTELQICSLIIKGMSSKEIAKFRGASPSTVNRQRDRIRDKLGLRNQRINLEMFLQRYYNEIEKVLDHGTHN